MFSRSLIRVSAIAVLVISVVWGFGCSRSDSDPARRGGGSKGTVPVEARVLAPQLLQDKITTTGSLLASEEVELRPEISGRVISVNFSEGKKARRGDLLIKINDAELQAQLKRKNVEEKQASDAEERAKKLHDMNAISQEEYDKVTNALHIVQAEREAIESQLAQTEIRAPFDGIVGLRYISEGGYVTPDILLATMQDIDTMKVEFSVPEKYAGRLKNGTEVLVQVGESQEAVRGAVYAVESKIDANTRTIKARARIPNAGLKLIPGSFAKVEITLEEFPTAIVIPSEAVIPEITGEKVFICQNGKAKAVPIQTGIRTERTVQITQGLAANDTLITTGLLQLADGKGVQVKLVGAN